MSKRLAIRVGIFVALLCMLGVPAVAQPGGGVAAKLEALEKRIAELEKAAVQVPTIAETARSLSEQLTVAKQRLQVLEAGQHSIPDAVAVLDKLALDVGDLERAVESMRTRVAGLEQPVEPATSSAAAGTGVSYNHGFAWATGDGLYSLKLDGFMQIRYQGRFSEDFDDTLSSTMRMRRGRLGATGMVASPKLTFHLMADFTQTNSLRDYYVDYAVLDGGRMSVRAGQYKTQFARGFLTSSSRFIFPDRTVAMDRFRYDRDLQVGVHGRLVDERLGYHLTVGNGAGLNQQNDNIDMAVTGRAEFAVVGERMEHTNGDVEGSEEPRLMVGVGAVHDLVATPSSISGVDLANDVDADGDVDNVRVISVSADALFRYRGLEVGLEWLYRYEDWGTILQGQVDATADDFADLVGTDGTRSYNAVFGHAGYMVVPKKLLVGARGSYAKLPFLGVGGRTGVLPTAARLVEFDAVVQLFGSSESRVLGLEYSLLNYNAADGGTVPAEDKEHRIVLETQIKF